MIKNRQSAHLASKRGRNKGGGKPGNSNGAKGPRVGRKDKTTKPLPQPRLEAKTKVPRRRKREKPPGSGRDFQKGQNSHTGEIFKRGADMVPRGNMTLYFKCLYYDVREALYQRHRRIVSHGSDRAVLALSDMIADRIEGTPARKSHAPAAHRSTFLMTMHDGKTVEMLPRQDAAKAAAAAPVTGDDAMILGLTSTKALVRA
jgi:hypothetical protein